MMNGSNTIQMKDMSITIYVKNKFWKLADKLHLYYLFRTKSMGSAVLSLQEFSYIKLLYESYFTIPLYSFTMHSLRGTLSVGWADRFSLWVGFYVYGGWFMGKLRGSLDFQHTMNKHYKQIFGTKRTSEYFR